MKTFFLLAVIHVLCAGNTAVNKNAKKAVESFTQFVVHSGKDTTTLNGKWFLQPMLSSDTATGKIPTLQINLAGSTFSGNTGCNTMRGSFQKTDSSLVFNKQIITTRMLCAGYDEAAFLRSLLRVNRYRLEKDILVLMFDATELSRWARKPGGLPKANKA
ncbi:MAG: META domain-containing protein [Chitinophagaceae bacterium]